MSAGYSHPAIESIARLVSARTGLSLVPASGPHVEAAIRRAMERSGAADAGGYLETLHGAEKAFDDLVAEVTVGESYFFREPAQFELIRTRVLPDIVARTGPRHRIRVWSAGCAGGEEPYSLAILLESAALGARADVLATDVSRAALARARRGVYRAWSLRGVGPEILAAWFRAEGPLHHLDERIRRRVRFSYLNLATGEFPSARSGVLAQDLILCRNVFIYFDPATIARVARRLYDTLAADGWLICGSSDPPLAALAPFETVRTGRAIVYRRRTAERGTSAADVPAGEVADGPPPSDCAALTPAPDIDRDVRPPPRADAAARGLLDPELHFQRGLELAERGPIEHAAAHFRRAIYLDRRLATAHFALGLVLERSGEFSGALRAFRNAARIAAANPPGDAAALGDGETFGSLAAAARAAMKRASVRLGAPPA